MYCLNTLLLLACWDINKPSFAMSGDFFILQVSCISLFMDNSESLMWLIHVGIQWRMDWLLFKKKGMESQKLLADKIPSLRACSRFICLVELKIKFWNSGRQVPSAHGITQSDQLGVRDLPSQRRISDGSGWSFSKLWNTKNLNSYKMFTEVSGTWLFSRIKHGTDAHQK